MHLSPLLNASFAIQIHVAAAIAALLLGGAILLRRKGDAPHRIAGRVWGGLMIVVAGSSFFIHEVRMWGPWSPIHLLSLLTLASLAWGVRMARIRRHSAHRRIMLGLYMGALVITGFFTLLPGRIMHDVLFSGAPKPVAATLAGLILAALATGLAMAFWAGRGAPRSAVRED
ncbi:membrane protein [Camelimonas fluminis]|uniref:DUF2306 domain-containing protein n=1 Tax=Camelimonas fluminis TaxID=1576911 RepID=A0ABV7UD87_9HYPH|nr:DUF2306 domain-containing protein [Camelimonas fluminis]GHE48856.1 membrane protein [Camelimonas fluminis]